MTRSLLTFALLAWISATSSLAQLEVEWMRMGLPSGQLYPTQDDGFIILGSYSQALDVDGDHITDLDTLGGTDVYLARYDPSGQFLWARRAGGTAPARLGPPQFGSPTLPTDAAYALAATSDNRFYLAGRFVREIDFDEDGQPELTSSDSLSAFLAQYTIDGSFQWATTLPVYNGEINYLTIDEGANALYAIGRSQESANADSFVVRDRLDHAFYARLSLEGALEWIQIPTVDINTSPLPPIWMGAPALAPSGDLYIPGRYILQVDFDGEGPYPPLGDPDTGGKGFLLKVSPEGDVAWVQTAYRMVSAFNSPVGLSKAVWHDNAIIVGGGKAWGRVVFEGTDSTITVASTGHEERVLARYTPAGQLEWAYTTQSTLEPNSFGASLSTTYSPDMELDAAGRTWLIGAFNGEVDFDGDFIPEAPSERPNPFLAAYNGQGDLVTFMAHGNPVGTRGSFWLDAAPTSNGLLVSGALSDLIDLDGAGPYPPLYFPEPRHIIVKYRFDANSVLDHETEPAISQAQSLTLSPPFPHPIKGTSRLRIQSPTTQQVAVVVIDVLGREVQRLFEGVLPASTQTVLSFDATGLPSGHYIVQAVGEQALMSQQVVVIR